MTPAIPNGATVQSILTALVRTSSVASLRQAPEKYFGIRTLPNDVFTIHADGLSKSAFAGHRSALHIRQHHGVLPLAMSFYERERENQLWRQVELGERAAIRSLVGGGRSAVLMSPMFKHCLECVREQEAQFGVGHWMRAHQIAGVARCHVHGRPLMGCCAACGTEIGGLKAPTFPSDPCVQCGGTGRQPVVGADAPAQQSYAELVASALNGDIRDLRPSTRRLLLSRASALVGSREGLASELLNAWRVNDASELAAHLECEVLPKALAAAIDGGHLHVVPRPLWMAVVAFCKDVVNSDSASRQEFFEQLELRPEVPVLSPKQDELFTLLKGIAPVHFPHAALRALAQGQTYSNILRDRLAPRASTQQLLFSVGGERAYLHPSLRLTPFPIGLSVDLKRDYYRQIAIGARQNGVLRGQLKERHWAVYMWLLQNDLGWLNENYPCADRRRST